MVQPECRECGSMLFTQRIARDQRRSARGRTESHHGDRSILHDRVSDMRVLMDDLVVDGERIEYHWTLIGTNNGPGGTGKRVRIRGFESWKIGADGLIVSSQGHFDRTEYQRQLEHGATE